MPEILFRGKSKDNGEWVEGDLFNNYDGRLFVGEIVINSICNGRTADEYDIGIAFNEVIPETVGRYTGLTDKNGTKVFEGDIVKDEQSQMFGKVVYTTAADGFDGMAGFMVDDIDDGLQNYNGFWHLCEIVGNIHDNPELLEVKDNV